jgi:hypothetical protein
MDLKKSLLQQVLGLGGIPRQGCQIPAQRPGDRGVDAIESFEPAGLVFDHPSAELDIVEPGPR